MNYIKSFFTLIVLCTTLSTICMEQINNKECVESREFIANQENRSLIQKTIHHAIALRAAWHAAQKQDQFIENIVFSSIMQLIKNSNTPTEIALATTKRILFASKQISENKRIHVSHIANEVFRASINSQDSSERIATIYAARDAVLAYLQAEKQQH